MALKHNPLVIIPARGGSKGIPRKNIKPFCGKPLIHHTIEAALKAGASPERVIVSTDDDEIAAVACQAGIEVPYRRPARLGGDTVGSREVILDVMDWADARGIDYDTVLLLQPTSPLRTADDILDCLDAYIPGQTDMAVTVAEASANPYYDCFETDADGFLHVSKGDGMFTRRQDAPEAWQYNGAAYVINRDSIRQMPMGAFTRRRPSVMPRTRSVDIDTPLDWQIAELVMASSR